MINFMMRPSTFPIALSAFSIDSRSGTLRSVYLTTLVTFRKKKHKNAAEMTDSGIEI